jgi:hypothetical protein
MMYLINLRRYLLRLLVETHVSSGEWEGLERPRFVSSSWRKCLTSKAPTFLSIIWIYLFFVSFSYLFWVDASSEESMVLSLRGISSLSAAQHSGVDGSVESVLQWISFLQEEWLMVFDNADVPPPEVVEKFIPPGNRGNILITSRNRSMGRIVSLENRIEINEMDEADAITLLLKASGLDSLPEHLEVSKKIVTELYCIPLAIDHAGACIESGRCYIDQYLRLFSVHRQALMSDATFTGASKYNKTVYGTWDLSFKEIEKRASSGHSASKDAQAAQAAILIFQICAFYNHTSISMDIFQSAAKELKAQLWKKMSIVTGFESYLRQ